MVHRDLFELVAAQAVHPRITDVRDGDLVVEHQGADDRRAHALALGLRPGGLINDLVRAMNGIAQDNARARHSRALIRNSQVLALDGFAHQVDDGFHGNATGHFAGVVATHAIGEHQQSDVRVEGDRVLVVLPDLAGVGLTDEPQLAVQTHRAAAPRGCRYSVTAITLCAPRKSARRLAPGDGETVGTSTRP